MITITSYFVTFNYTCQADNRSSRAFAAVAAEFKGASFIITLVGHDHMRLLATWEKKLRGRDDKIVQTAQKELNLAVRIHDIP